MKRADERGKEGLDKVRIEHGAPTGCGEGFTVSLMKRLALCAIEGDGH